MGITDRAVESQVTGRALPISWLPASLRVQLTLWYTVLLAVPLIVFAMASYIAAARALEQRTDAFINDALSAFARELVAERRTMLSAVAAIETTVRDVRFRDLHIAVVDSVGSVVAMTTPADDRAMASFMPSPDVTSRVLALLRASGGLPRAASVPNAVGAFRVITAPLTIDGARFSVAGSYSLRNIEAVLQRIRQLFLVAIPLLLLVSAAGGYALAKRSLAPVDLMSAQAAEISASNMHHRLPVGGGAELVGLANVVNGLLERLEQSFVQQRRFVTDASHELRTPTAVVRTEADITLSRDHRTESEYRASVTVIQDAARRLTRIVDDLFLLSRVDSGHVVVRREPLYLEELLHSTTRAVRSVAALRSVDVSLLRVVDAPITGDADLLGRLFLNLFDNAIKYSPEGGTVDVTMAMDGADYLISVVDAGAGIPPEARERVFERFFRVDDARSRTESSATSGAGLGLAIARRIAEMHEGSITIADTRPGRTEFAVRLPVRA